MEKLNLFKTESREVFRLKALHLSQYCLKTIFFLYMSYWTSQFVKHILAQDLSLPKLALWALQILVVLAFIFILSYLLRRNFVSRFYPCRERCLISLFLRGLKERPLAKLVDRQVSDDYVRLTKDFIEIFEFEIKTMIVWLAALISAICYCVLLGLLSPIILLSFLILSCFQFLPALLFKFYFEKVYLNMRNVEGEMTEWISEAHHGFTTLRLFRALPWYFKKKEALNRSFLKNGYHAEAICALENAIEDLVASILRIGAYGVVGLFIGFSFLSLESGLASLVLAAPFFNTFKQLYHIFAEYGRNRAAKQRMRDFLDGEMNTHSDQEIKAEEVDLSAEDVAFWRENSDYRFSCQKLFIPQGTHAFVSGPNGSGKSTLVKLLIGALKPQEGKIRVAHLDPASLSDAMRYALFAYLEQDDFYEHISLKDFIQIYLPSNEKARFDEILSYFNFDPKLFEKDLSQLSGGELKKVHLALVFAQESALLILDEPSNHLEAEAKEKLKELISKEKRSILLISHDQQLRALCKLELKVQDGKVEVNHV